MVSQYGVSRTVLFFLILSFFIFATYHSSIFWISLTSSSSSTKRKYLHARKNYGWLLEFQAALCLFHLTIKEKKKKEKILVLRQTNKINNILISVLKDVFPGLVV